MANDTVSGLIAEKGPMTVSTRETLSKEIVLSPSSSRNRKSEPIEKRTSPTTLAVRSKSETTRYCSPSSDPSASSSESSVSKNQQKKYKTVKQLMVEVEEESEDEEDDVGAFSSNLKTRTMDARIYRAVLKKTNGDCHEESSRMDRSTQEGGDRGEGKIDECFKGNRSGSEAVSTDGILPDEDAEAKEMSAESRFLSEPVKELLENNVTLGSLLPSNDTIHETREAPDEVQSDCRGEETSQMLVSKNSILNENLIRKCVGHDKGENLISSKRKISMVDMHSDVSATLVDDDNCKLVVDAGPSTLYSNIVETSGSCSKRIRRISLSDVQRDQRKLINNVDQPSSKSDGEKLSTRNKEGKSGDPVERTQGNGVETEKIRKQQRSLHLLLKPEIAKLCEILLLPDDVKSMVENCLEYTMNNYQICTEPVSILQAFQLSLCWTAASLLKHKLDFEASLMLAKQHLNFDCKKEMVDEINSRLSDLREKFLFLKGNSNVIGSPKASESSNRVYSYTEVTPEVELTKKDNSKNLKDIRKRDKQFEMLLLMQQTEKQKLKEDIENEKAEFGRKYKIERAAIQSFSPHEVNRKEKLKVFKSEYYKRIGELERLHEILLKDLEAKQLEARRKFLESGAPDELLNVVASKELGTSVKYLQTHDQAQPHNAPKALVSDHVAEGKSFQKIVESMTRTGSGVGLSETPDTNSSLGVLCSGQVELKTSLVKHAGANEMEIMASKDESVSRNKCNNIAENEYDSQGNIISKHSNSGEQCSDGATSMTDEGEGCENCCRESHNDCGQDTVTLVLPSNGEICDGETSDVPSGEVVLAVHKTSSSNDDQVEVPSSRQGKLDGTILSKPVCGFSVEVKANGFSDGVNNMASLSLQSPKEPILSVNTMCLPNCENAAQINEADNSNGSNNTDILNSPLSDKRISSWNSKSPQEHVHGVNVMCMPNCGDSAQIHEDDDRNGSNNVVILNSPLIDGEIDDGTIVSVLDIETHVGMPAADDFTPSMKRISGGAVNVSVLDRELLRPCGTSSPSNSPNAANSIILLNQPSLEKQNPDGVSLSIPAGQIPVEVPETSREGAAVSVLDRDAAGGMPGTFNCTDYPENVSPLNSSSTNQISDGGSVLDGVLSSRPCGASSPSNGPNAPNSIILLNQPSLEKQNPDGVSSSIPAGQIPVEVPETSHEGAAVSVLDREAAGGMSGTFNCTDYPENVSPPNSSSTNQISDGGSVLDGVLSSRPCGASSPSNCPNAANSFNLLNLPSLEKQNPDGVSSIPVEVPETSHEGAAVSVLDREAAGGMPGTFNCADYPENVSPLNSSSTNQISDGGSVLDGVLSSRPCGASSPSNCPATISPLNPPSLQQQIPDRVLLSIPDGQIPVIVPENSHEVAECQLTDSAMVDKSTTSDQQEGVRGTMTENNLLQETSVSRPVDLMDPLEQVLPSSSVESPPDQDTYREMHNSLLSSPIDVVPDNQSNHVSVVMEPSEQVDQLPSAGFLSSNQGPSNLPLVTGIEDRPTNEDALSSHIPEASIEVQNQAVEQPASDLDSLMPGGVRTESSDTRNLSTPTEINSHLIPTATQSASRIVPPLGRDPLKLEMEKLHNLTEQNMKSREDKKLQLKSDFEKECEELRRKYEIKLKDIEVELQKTRKNLDTQRNKVLVNKILAEAFMSICECTDLKAYDASGMQQDANASFSQQLIQPSRLQNATWSSSVASPSSSGPPAASLQSSYATTSSQTMVPPIQSTYNTSGSVSARLPHINSISSPSGNLQAGGEIRAPAPHLQRYRPSTSISGGEIRAPAPHLQPYRPSTSVPSGEVRAPAPHLQPYRPSTSVRSGAVRAPAPHLQPYRPSTSVPAPSHCTVPHGIPSQPTPGIPVNSPLFTPQLPQLTPTTFQSDPYWGHWPESTGGLLIPNFSAVDLCADAHSQFGINPPNVLSSMSDLASLNPSQFGTRGSMPANSAHQATSSDFVCLSDDE